MIRFANIQDRIIPMRSDKKDREGMLAFQVAARRLASETLALQEIVLFTMPLGAFAVNPYTYATAIVTNDGTVITGIDPATWESTDNPFEKEPIHIFKADWQDPTTGRWRVMHLYNQGTLEKHMRHVEPGDGYMRAFTSDQGRFRPNRPPGAATQVRVQVAYKPIGDFDEVHFGSDFEDALVEGALSYYMRLPGSGQDREEAARAEDRYNAIASGLRGSELIGDAGFSRGSTSPKRGERYGRFMSHDTLGY
jgi:hypothetical protein